MIQELARWDPRSVRTPPQCEARRRPSLWELLKFRMLGPVRGFDSAIECRCRKYAGHETRRIWGPLQDPHEDLTGHRWLP